MKALGTPKRCEKHKNYKKKPTWKCRVCKKYDDFWKKLNEEGK